ncbi:24886_t:CDS:2, partial [Gigaspora rosea]
SIKKIHQIQEVRIATLQKPSKRPSSEDSDEENFPTQLPDNAKPVRNANGNINVQISFIVDKYKHTLNADDKKKFNRIKMDYVIEKDDKFLLTKYTKRKIEDVKVLIKNINDYIWLMSTKKIKGTKCNKLEKDPKYKDPAQYPILFNPGKFSLTNPLGFPEEYIDDEENIKQIIIQYQQSLKKQSEISTDNLKKIQNFLINGIKSYNNNDNKKEYLHKIFKILVTRELDDIENDDDINNVFDSLNFTF